MSIAQINGIEIHYRITDFTDPWTAPETVLLHHGFARNLKFWYAWVPLLCRNYRVLTMDSRGHGESTRPLQVDSFSLDQFADDAIGLLDHLKVEKVHWGGEASGGIVGVAAALRHPRRVASLTLCNTPLFPIPPASEHLFVAEEVEKYGLGYWARKATGYRNDATHLPSGWLEWSIAENDRMPAKLAIGLMKMLSKVDLSDRLPEVFQPTVSIVGDGAAATPHARLAEMTRRMPHARLVVLHGYKFGVAFTAPEKCVQEMKVVATSAALASQADK